MGMISAAQPLCSTPTNSNKVPSLTHKYNSGLIYGRTPNGSLRSWRWI